MNQQARRKSKNIALALGRTVSVATRLRRFGIFKLIGLVFALGLFLSWASVFWIPNLIHWGIPERTANQFPFIAFGCGAVFGLAVVISQGARQLLWFIGAPLLTGAVFWFFGVLLGGILVAMNFSLATVDTVPAIAFFVGASLGALGSVGILLEKFGNP